MGGTEVGRARDSMQCASGKVGHAQSQPEPRAYQTEKITSKEAAEALTSLPPIPGDWGSDLGVMGP